MMTPQTILDSLRTKPVCGICRGTSGHEPIPDDGDALVCYACILRLGRMVADPMHADPDRLVDLAAAHEDVVELKPCQEHGGCWAWVGWAA